MADQFTNLPNTFNFAAACPGLKPLGLEPFPIFNRGSFHAAGLPGVEA